MHKLERKGDWIQTYNRRQFWTLDPRAEDVDIEDIAHSLSMLCRFNGHCNEFYSVAQHSVFVSELVKPQEALAGLLHDSPEAYLGDIARPIKKFLPGIEEIENELEKVIFKYFNIDNYDKKEISHADNIALFTEMRDLMNEPPEMWKEFEYYLPLLPKNKIIPLTSKESKKLFLERFEELRANNY